MNDNMKPGGYRSFGDLLRGGPGHRAIPAPYAFAMRPDVAQGTRYPGFANPILMNRMLGEMYGQGATPYTWGGTK